MTRPLRLDTHCHLDQYPDIASVKSRLHAESILVIAVTHVPSAFERLRRNLVGTPNIRFALGAHPLTTNKLNSLEWALFNRYLTDTSYIGEVGLDFSPDGVATRSDQEQTFRRVLSAVAGKHKVLTLHSRRAEATVAELLAEYAVGPAIFHWYSGSVSILDRILEAGHYLSFNPAMIRSKNGQRIIARVPADRVLVETDGPYTTVAGRPTTPQDVDVVYTYLAALQQQDVEAVISQVYRNFMSLLNVR